jgi:bacterioferritin
MFLLYWIGSVLLIGGMILSANALNLSPGWVVIPALIIIGLLIWKQINASKPRINSIYRRIPDKSNRTPTVIQLGQDDLIQSSKAGLAAGKEKFTPSENELSDVETLRNRAQQNIQEGAITESYTADRFTINKLLNDALATETVCVLRYRRHHFMARGIHAKSIAAEFLAHSIEEQGHADQIAERIVQLGGEPDFSPDTLSQRSHAEYASGSSLTDMIKENLIAERIAIDSYREFIQYLGDKDSTTSQILKNILAVEEKHADELADMLTDIPAPTS